MTADSSASGFLLPTSDLPVNDEALDDLFRVTIAGITGLDPRHVVRRFKAEPSAPLQFDSTWASVGVIDFDDDGFAQQGMRKDGSYKRVQREQLPWSACARTSPSCSAERPGPMAARPKLN